MRTEMQRWLVAHEYDSIEMMRGSMNILRAPSPSVFSRANYMRVLQTWETE
jgi:dihydroorotate dehydrogenase (fumarate)